MDRIDAANERIPRYGEHRTGRDADFPADGKKRHEKPKSHQFWKHGPKELVRHKDGTVTCEANRRNPARHVVVETQGSLSAMSCALGGSTRKVHDARRDTEEGLNRRIRKLEAQRAALGNRAGKAPDRTIDARSPDRPVAEKPVRPRYGTVKEYDDEIEKLKGELPQSKTPTRAGFDGDGFPENHDAGQPSIHNSRGFGEDSPSPENSGWPAPAEENRRPASLLGGGGGKAFGRQARTV